MFFLQFLTATQKSINYILQKKHQLYLHRKMLSHQSFWIRLFERELQLDQQTEPLLNLSDKKISTAAFDFTLVKFTYCSFAVAIVVGIIVSQLMLN